MKDSARIRALGAAGIAALAAALTLGAPIPGDLPAREAAASVPSGTPTFTTPLVIDNTYFPVRPSTIKVFRGWEGRRRITVVEQHLAETRTFDWDGTPVPCRVVRESKFESGVTTEVSRSFFAQADDGSVWYFGEIAEPIEDEDPEDEPLDTESEDWIVGAALPEDPPEVNSAPDPFLFMPATPERFDTWKTEDFFPIVDETVFVTAAGVRVRVPAGRFRDCIRVVDTTQLDPGMGTKWFAPGVGLIRERGRGEGLSLQASTLRRK